ncbi:hypothetical protein EYB25_007264 [Talaromyces marneffei]|nr:hypothetical protein EYB25_007264 [Talaromyces marneffei]
MTSSAKRRLQALSQQLVEGIPDAGTFEGIPRIRTVAGDSVGQRVKDKVVIVTGANSPIGIGRASAHQYARNGAEAVYLCDYDDTYLPTHKREIESLYPDVEVQIRQFDAGDAPSVKAVVDDAIARYGRLDIMFANAGIVGSTKLFTEIEPEDFMKTLKTNTLGVFLAAKYAAPAMQITSVSKPFPSGSIICTASVAGLRSNAGGTDYSASKAAVVNIAQTTCYQLAGTGVRVNAICPGVIETGMTKVMYDAARARGTQDKIGQLNPLRRGAVADEVARVALFLGSDESSYMNGQAVTAARHFVYLFSGKEAARLSSCVWADNTPSRTQRYVEYASREKTVYAFTPNIVARTQYSPRLARFESLIPSLLVSPSLPITFLILEDSRRTPLYQILASAVLASWQLPLKDSNRSTSRLP